VTAPPPGKPTRRSLLAWVWGLLGLAAATEAAWVALSFLLPKPRAADDEESSLLVAGPVEQFGPGTVTAFPRGKLYLVRLEDGGFLALSRTCTHLGCTLPWEQEQQRFVCPCHASAFSITGDVLSPPAPRPLDRFPIRIENQIIKVDTSKPRRPSTPIVSRAVYA